MDSSLDRNPSLPPELLKQFEDVTSDRVGDTVFSKRWIIQVLISIIESVNKEGSENEITKDLSESDQETANAIVSEDIQEIDKKLEDDACVLWDMSVDKDVADFLQEFKAADILVEVIAKTKCPRLVEIIIGILGNIAFFDNICEELANNEDVVNTVIQLVGSSDAPTVIQVLRFIRTGVMNTKSFQKWHFALKKDDTFMSNMKFILGNSLNNELLKGAVQLLYYVLDSDVISCKIWATESYAKSLECVATQLASHKDGTAIDELWLLLNILCQDEVFIATIGNHFDAFYNVFILYINLFEEYDHILPCSERISAVSASFNTFATLAKENEGNIKLSDDKFFQTIKRMSKATKDALTKLTENRSFQNSNVEHTSQEQFPKNNIHNFCKDDENSLDMLLETITTFCKIVAPSLIENQLCDEDKG